MVSSSRLRTTLKRETVAIGVIQPRGGRVLAAIESAEITASDATGATALMFGVTFDTGRVTKTCLCEFARETVPSLSRIVAVSILKCTLTEVGGVRSSKKVADTPLRALTPSILVLPFAVRPCTGAVGVGLLQIRKTIFGRLTLSEGALARTAA